MPWVQFISDFDWQKSPRVVTAYKAGMVQLVSQACRDEAVRLGKARDTERPAGAPAVTAVADSSPSPMAPNAPLPRVRRRSNAGG